MMRASLCAVNGDDLLRGPKGSPQQPIGLQLLDPLAVQHIRLAPAHILQMPRLDQEDLQPALFQDLLQRDPVHPGRFHRHRRDPTGLQPVPSRSKSAVKVAQQRTLSSSRSGAQQPTLPRPPCRSPLHSVGFALTHSSRRL